MEDSSAWVQVLAINRGDEGRVEALNHVVGQRVALVLNLLDLEGGVPVGRIGRQHALEQCGTRDNAVGEGREIGKELLVFGNKAKSHEGILSHFCYMAVTTAAGSRK